ncbi:DJ-1/PfpI family protein [Marinobacter vulgaris]|nr:DJ-1/PfpI family protein [Marinobacter vulgaris]
MVHFVGPRVGLFAGESGEKLEADKSLENAPGFLFDALVVPDGSAAAQALVDNPDTMEFVKDHFKHCKTILALGAGRKLLEKACIGAEAEQDPGILLADSADAAAIAPAFMEAIAAQRHPSREGV